MLEPLLSLRGGTTVASLNRPWRFAPTQRYDPDTNPEGLISLGAAENVLVTSEVLDFVDKNYKISAQDLLYRSSQSGSSKFAAVLAQHLNEYLNPHTPIGEEHVRIATSATAMHDTLAWALADKGDAILMSRPVYGRLELDFFNKSGVKVEYADTPADSQFDKTVVGKYEEALESCKSRGVKVKAVWIVNPHNPLGRCYLRETLIAILGFCQKHKLPLISDEIYACSVFDSGEPDAVPFTSVLSIDAEKHIDPRLLHVTYGLSKDFGAAGLRIGAIITRSGPVLQAVDGVSRFQNAAGPSLSIGTAMLSDRDWCRSFIDGNRKKLAAAYRHVTSGLSDIGVKYMPGSNAGFFVYIDLSPYLSDKERFPEFELTARLDKAGVFLHPKEEHALEPGWFRLVYTQDPGTIAEGLKRIKSAIS